MQLRKSSRIHNFNQEEIREKLQAFPGGSIDLRRQESGVAVLTVNNPSRMNAFSGRVCPATVCWGGEGGDMSTGENSLSSQAA